MRCGYKKKVKTELFPDIDIARGEELLLEWTHESHLLTFVSKIEVPDDTLENLIS